MTSKAVSVLADSQANARQWGAWLGERGRDVVAAPSGRRPGTAQALLLVGDSVRSWLTASRDRGWEYGLDLHLVAGTPVLALGGAMSALFETVTEGGVTVEGLGQWPGAADWTPPTAKPVRILSMHDAARLAGLACPTGTLTVASAPLCTTWELHPHGPFTAVAPEVTWADTNPTAVVGVHNGPLRAVAAPASCSHAETPMLVSAWLRDVVGA